MKNKLTTFLTHAAGWILFLSLPVLFVAGQQGNGSLISVLSHQATWLFFLTYIIIFYVNTYLLLPYLYLKKRFVLYVATVALLFMTVFFAKPFDRMVAAVSRNTTERMEDHPPPPDEARPFRGGPKRPPPRMERQEGPRVDVVSIFLFVMIMALSMAIETRQRLRRTEQRALKAEADKANAELSFLKTQINPHFLFNTLNNIYSLAVTKNEYTADSIMKLSNIMRYITDEIGEDYVRLQHEVECMRDYIDLQKLRLGKTTRVNFEVSGQMAEKKIAPLILMSFIENVFKYGTSNHEMADIVISLEAKEDSICFYCRNRLFDMKPVPERTGIGIANTRQRLEHLYPGRHSLTIKKENGYFIVELVLTS
jgi:two-component system LytT family sensor kinase